MDMTLLGVGGDYEGYLAVWHSVSGVGIPAEKPALTYLMILSEFVQEHHVAIQPHVMRVIGMSCVCAWFRRWPAFLNSHAV